MCFIHHQILMVWLSRNLLHEFSCFSDDNLKNYFDFGCLAPSTSGLARLTWMPGKGVTSEPVAIRMFLVLMTCSLPSAATAVTWFFPVTRPKPLTWVT